MEKKIEEIIEKNLDFWRCIEKMEKNIEEIIETKKGNINLDFWRTIIMETKENINEYENCVTFKKEKIIRGWICDFYPSMNKNPEISHRDLADEINEVPIAIELLNTGEKKVATLYAGITDLKQDPKTFVVEPIVNYSFSY